MPGRKVPTSSTNFLPGGFPVDGGGGGEGVPPTPTRKFETVEHLVLQLERPELRDSALQELTKRSSEAVVLAPLLWRSFGAIAWLLQDITSIYHKLSPPTLTLEEAYRVGYAIVLLKFVASHPDTKMQFMKADIGSYLHPFLNTKDLAKPLEHLRITALIVIGGLAKCSEPKAIHYLLQGEIIPKCIHSIAVGGNLSKTIATFIIRRILLNEFGLNHICSSADRFSVVVRTLAQMVTNETEKPSPELLKNIIHCYLNLTNNASARNALRRCLPNTLRDGTFNACVEGDPKTTKCLQKLLSEVGENGRSQP